MTKSKIPERIWRLAEQDMLRREVIRLKAIGVIKDKEKKPRA